jgi:hypothetical protein
MLHINQNLGGSILYVIFELRIGTPDVVSGLNFEYLQLLSSVLHGSPLFCSPDYLPMKSSSLPFFVV